MIFQLTWQTAVDSAVIAPFMHKCSFFKNHEWQTKHWPNEWQTKQLNLACFYSLFVQEIR